MSPASNAMWSRFKALRASLHPSTPTMVGIMTGAVSSLASEGTHTEQRKISEPISFNVYLSFYYLIGSRSAWRS